MDNGYPSGGNYWSNYNGIDVDQDGIGDAPYLIDAGQADNYPLMAPIRTFHAGTWNNVPYSVDIVSNSTLSSFSFNATAKTITVDVTGTDGTVGFPRVAIPKTLMWTSTDAEWTVTVNGTLIDDRLITNDASNTYIYFTYHHSTETVQIQSTGAVPEVQLLMLLPLFLAITLLGAFAAKIRRKIGK